jgi:hypothetical protein
MQTFQKEKTKPYLTGMNRIFRIKTKIVYRMLDSHKVVTPVKARAQRAVTILETGFRFLPE